MKNRNLSGGLFAAGNPKPLTIRESPLSAQIKDYLGNRGIWNERLNSGKIETKSGRWIHLCERGTPDRLAIVRGIAVFIETKMRGQKPSPDQLRKHDELRRSGAVVIVADDFGNFRFEFEAIRARIEAVSNNNTKGVNLYD